MNSPSKREVPESESLAAPAAKPARAPRKKAIGEIPVPAAPRKRKTPAKAETTAPAPAPRKRASAKADSSAAAATPRKRKATAKSAPGLDLLVRDAVVARLDAMKANDMKVIDVRGKTSITDCLVIVSGTSTRHVKSMGDEVVVTAKKLGLPPLGVEGEKDAEWMLVDLGDTVVHLMLPKTREFYGLERLWSLTEESRATAATV